MAHHKRHRPKNRRAGCLLCKPWKTNGFAHRRRLEGEQFAASRARRAAELEIAEYWVARSDLSGDRERHPPRASAP